MEPMSASTQARFGRALFGRAMALGVILSAGLLAACVVGPNYHRPAVQAPPAWKEAPPPGWKNATPREEISKGNWWSVFGDSQLDQLEAESTAANPSLQAAVARLEQARAAARVTRANLRPAVELNPSVVTSRQSGNRPVPPPVRANPFTSTTFTLPFDAGYEADVWGSVRRSLESAQAGAQASAADYENLLLTLRSEVAQDYFYIRYLDDDRAILRDNIELLKRAVRLTEVRHAGGVASGLDVSEARTLLASTEAQYAGTARDRAQFEHALAVLVGKSPAEFSLAEAPPAKGAVPPVVPAGLPSDLLERRPDIARAERLMASANAGIGVARAAFFPAVGLTAGAGYASTDLIKLFNLPSAMWSLGASAAAPLYEGGRLKAGLEQAQAAYTESVANYRQQILTAFQEVEDGLSGLRVLEEQQDAQNKAVDSSLETANISTARYKEGLANYLEVIVAQRAVLDNQRLDAQIRELRFATTVQLIKALGGGWSESHPAIYSSGAQPAGAQPSPARTASP